MVVAYTGGKDSTLLLYLIKTVCEEQGRSMPTCFCIDEGDMFDEVKDFIRDIEARWDVNVEMIHNHDVSRAAGGELGAMVNVEDLNEYNRTEIERLRYDEDEFPYEPESFVGNHLMKTATLNRYLFDQDVEAFFEGIRWDEQGARADETYFSEREGSQYNPAHTRVFPILHFTERDVWDATFHCNIPVCSLYRDGFRSLGARVTTTRNADVPAWEQDLENTDERGGRRQDKEGLMAKLRKLGYM
jgi:phosphoadenosine phosphosulfate reductase